MPRRQRLMSEAMLNSIREMIADHLATQSYSGRPDWTFTELVLELAPRGITEHYLKTELDALVSAGRVDVETVRRDGRRVRVYRAHRYDARKAEDWFRKVFGE